MLPDEFRINFVVRPWHLLISPLGALLAIGVLFLPWEAESAPAWVQAIGSIGAIAGAAWATRHSIESERAARVDQTKERLKVVTGALEEIAKRSAIRAGRLNDLHKEGKVTEREVYARTIVDGLELDLRRVDQISLTDLPAASLIKPLVNLVLSLELATSCAKRLLEDRVMADPQPFIQFRYAVDAIRELAAVFRAIGEVGKLE